MVCLVFKSNIDLLQMFLSIARCLIAVHIEQKELLLRNSSTKIWIEETGWATLLCGSIMKRMKVNCYRIQVGEWEGGDGGEGMGINSYRLKIYCLNE